MVNKATAVFHWKRDVVGAEGLCKEALEIDPLCDGAYAALGQMYLQMHDYEKAITAFRQLLDVSTNMGQIALALYHSYVSQSQSTFQYYGTDACSIIVDGSACQSHEELPCTRCSAEVRLWT
jgi:import receptor subunit TOM70